MHHRPLVKQIITAESMDAALLAACDLLGRPFSQRPTAPPLDFDVESVRVPIMKAPPADLPAVPAGPVEEPMPPSTVPRQSGLFVSGGAEHDHQRSGT